MGTKSFGKISLITANLPCRVDLGPVWCMFNLMCEQGQEEEFLAQLRQATAAFTQEGSRVLYLSEGYERDTIETMKGEEEVSIFTLFLTVKPLTVDKVRALNVALVDLYGTAPDDLQLVIQELVAP